MQSHSIIIICIYYCQCSIYTFISWIVIKFKCRCLFIYFYFWWCL